MAIPYLTKNLRHRITSIKCFLFCWRESTMLWLVNSATLPHLVTTISNAAAALWQFVCWWFSKHLGAFFHHLNQHWCMLALCFVRSTNQRWTTIFDHRVIPCNPKVRQKKRITTFALLHYYSKQRKFQNVLRTWEGTVLYHFKYRIKRSEVFLSR